MPTDQRPAAPALAPDPPPPPDGRSRSTRAGAGRSPDRGARAGAGRPPAPERRAIGVGSGGDDPRRAEWGQATAEYALVMLAAAAIAGLLLAWAASTGGIGRLLDSVMDSLIGQTEADE